MAMSIGDVHQLKTDVVTPKQMNLPGGSQVQIIKKLDGGRVKVISLYEETFAIHECNIGDFVPPPQVDLSQVGK